MAGYEPYVPGRHKAAFHDYVRSIDAYDAAQAKASGAAPSEVRRQGGARAHDDQRGLWDMTVRSRHLEADGIAGEVIFTQGSLPFAPYPAIGPARKMDWAPAVEQRNAGPEIYNRWLADLCSADSNLHYGVAAVPIRDIDAAVAEVARARKSGLNGGILLPATAVNGEYPCTTTAPTTGCGRPARTMTWS